MRRRDFIAARQRGGSVAAAVRAQQPGVPVSQ
jgi:hypothetical protein